MGLLSLFAFGDFGMPSLSCSLSSAYHRLTHSSTFAIAELFPRLLVIAAKPGIPIVIFFVLLLFILLSTSIDC
jgi:hypothetical protein